MIQLPPVIAGTSSLGNLYEALPFLQKKQIVNAYLEASGRPAVFDTAGKYGAGLALETLSLCLDQLGIAPSEVIISNKLGWMRTPLRTAEPTFEPGVWKNLEYDARQNISYAGILECFEQGNTLLGDYTAQMVSIHDPDEYLAAADNEAAAAERYQHILDAYRALHELKAAGRVQSIGIGSKDWATIQRISGEVALDWVMLANSLTIYKQPPELLAFVGELAGKGVTVINSAVFHGGFLTGSNYYNYQPVSRSNEAHQSLYRWRDHFYAVCGEFEVEPAAACIQFARSIPGISSIALNSTSPVRTQQNVVMASRHIPGAFWKRLQEQALLPDHYDFI